MVDTNDEWIVERTGIRERRIAADDETTCHASAPKRRAWPSRPPASTPTTSTSSSAPPARRRHVPVVGLPDPGRASAPAAPRAFDVNAACVGFVAALATGAQFINAGVYERVLVVGSEVPLAHHRLE